MEDPPRLSVPLFFGVVGDMGVLEIRTYRLKPGTGAAFHSTMVERCMPLLGRFGIRVLRFGPSERNEDGVEEYVLLRSFESLPARDEQEERFYGSEEWQSGPRRDIVSRIESFHTVVLTVPAEAIQALET